MSGSTTKKLRMYWTNLIEAKEILISFRKFKRKYRQAINKPVLPTLKEAHNNA